MSLFCIKKLELGHMENISYNRIMFMLQEKLLDDEVYLKLHQAVLYEW